MPLQDVQQGRDVTGTLIEDIVLHLLSYVAKMEWEYIRQSQAEGIDAEKARGMHSGRRSQGRPSEFSALRAERRENRITARDTTLQLGISHKTFHKSASEAAS